MTSPPPAKLWRARPLLGTVVEIHASGLPVARLQCAVERAFAVIARVQALMSFHDSASDLSRLNREAHRHAVHVDALTWTLLRHARALTRASVGRFDPAMVPFLQRWGLLPRSPAADTLSPRPRGPGRFRGMASIQLLPGHLVRFPAPLTLDLGGIAKGYAVDLAIAALRRAGVPRGVVNAGGDLRVYGDHAEPLHVRHPRRPGVFFHVGALVSEAAATSSLTFSHKIWRGHSVGALVDPRTGIACRPGISITVVARAAWLADALTKVVAIDPSGALPLLAHHRARALLLDATGRATWLGGVETTRHAA